MNAPTPATLRETIKDQIGSFLFKEGFKSTEPLTQEGIFHIINMLADYQEEGKVLYPEVLVTNDLTILKAIPDFKTQIGVCEITEDAFKKIIKSCAPLCNSEWIIYIEVKDGILTYGVSCAEITETTASMYSQVVGPLKIEIPGCTVAYIRNIGKKTVEVSGLRSRILVSLSLDDPSDLNTNEINLLCEHICRDLKDDIKITAISYYEKILGNGLKEGHGNLIGVVDGSVEGLKALKLAIPDGTFIPNPIDIPSLLYNDESEKSRQSTTLLRQQANLIKAMVNNDGIAIFSTNGTLIGYHFILRNNYFNPDEVKAINGGARTHTFHNMIASKVFCFCFIKSQDGPVKVFSL